MPKDYNKTLNLPITDFPMRASLPEKEPRTLENWEKEKIYLKVMERNRNKPIYLLHDGPPYANGDIHLGHALNKILKDFVVRYKNMCGFKAPFIPGWDTHGLPTELKAASKVGKEKLKSLPSVEIRKICKEFALSYVNNQREQFKRLGSMGDWDNPYITLQPEFEKKQIELFAKMAGKGFIYRGLKPVYWCPTCETALAEAEIEYSDDSCVSIYVKFKIADDKGKLEYLGVDLQKTYFVIWTTTAWTLPANTAICLGANFEYSVIKCGNEFYIIASELLEKSMSVAGLNQYEVIGKLKGSNLEYIEVYHPFLDRKSVVINGDHVTLESGTGCVHTAPGHGVEDFEVCGNYDNIPVIVPVDSRGILTHEAGEFGGLNTKNASEKIIEHLQKSNLLFASKQLNHQYPHCWRCKSPVIFRATEQWFCSIDELKDQAIKAIDGVKWIPEWGKNRISSMVTERKNWCISRQRKWGVPIPIFFCEECGEPIINEKIMNSVAEIFGKEGSDAWFIRDSSYFIPEEFKCTKCGNSRFIKETDIMDVWFDSGVTHEVVCNEKNSLKWPADLYLEGADQYRGWFQSSLLTSVASRGGAPYKAVATHGWVVDEEGKKQSKSQGNGVAPSDVINKYGADILRLWAASSDYHCDIKISNNILKQISESYRKIRNTARYIIGNLYDFNPNKDMVELSNLCSLDKWAVARLNEVINKVKESYDSLEFHNVYHTIHKFCIVDMSNFYLDILKDRLYVYAADSKERRCAQTSMYIILDAITKLLSPILPFTTDEIWKYMPHKDSDNKKYVILNDMPSESLIDVSEEFMSYWEYIHKLREEITKILETSRKNKVIGSSLDAMVYLYCSEKDYNFIKDSKDILKTSLIVSGLQVFNEGSGEEKAEEIEGLTITVKHAEGKKCERCWTYSNTVGEDKENPDLCERCVKILK